MRFLPLLALCLAATTAAHAGRYSLKQEDADVGSHVKRDIARGSLPFDKTYAQLSADQRAQVHSAYEDLVEGDEPPWPQEGMKAIMQQLSKAQSHYRARGKLSVIAVVDAEGLVQDVQFLATPSTEMAQATAVVLMGAKFKPGICAGQPCAMEFPLRINFELR